MTTELDTLPAFQVPSEYQDKEYLKDIKSNEDLFKSYDNIQQLLGKRPAGVPHENATDEEWETYHNTLRPESFDKYDFDDSILPEGVTRNEESAKAVKEIFHKAGLTAKQGKLIQAEYERMVIAEQSGSEDEAALQDKNFEEISSKVFGDRKEEALGISKGLLEKYAPADLKGHVAGLDNNSLMLLASVLDRVNTEYIKEDGPGGGGSGGGGSNAQDKREEAIKLMSSPDYKDAFSPRHEEIKQKVDDIYASLN